MKVSKVDARRIGREIRNHARVVENEELFKRGVELMELSFDAPHDPFTVPKKLEELIPKGDRK